MSAGPTSARGRHRRTVADGERLVGLATPRASCSACRRSPFPGDDPNRATVEAVIAARRRRRRCARRLLLAESVHQLRAAATRPARRGAGVDREAPPRPNPTSTRTPRSGVGLTHRIAVRPSSRTGGPAPSWGSTARAPAPCAEPASTDGPAGCSAHRTGSASTLRPRCRGNAVSSWSFTHGRCWHRRDRRHRRTRAGTHGEASELRLGCCATPRRCARATSRPTPCPSYRSGGRRRRGDPRRVALLAEQHRPGRRRGEPDVGGRPGHGRTTVGAPAGIDAPSLGQRADVGGSRDFAPRRPLPRTPAIPPPEWTPVGIAGRARRPRVPSSAPTSQRRRAHVRRRGARRRRSTTRRRVDAIDGPPLSPPTMTSPAHRQRLEALRRHPRVLPRLRCRQRRRAGRQPSAVAPVAGRATRPGRQVARPAADWSATAPNGSPRLCCSPRPWPASSERAVPRRAAAPRRR